MERLLADAADVIVTGGGTGGHVFPAIEVAKELQQRHAVTYFGSLRGQEADVCLRAGLPFEGFASEPLTSLRTLRGLRSAIRLLRAQARAAKALAVRNPKVVFSTGGYSSAPVIGAARRLGIPYVIHEQNTVPGRTNRIFSRRAFAVATVFERTEIEFPSARVIRTGMPVRSAIREKAAQGQAPDQVILVTGGSQGALALNEAALQAAAELGSEWSWIHIAGPSHAGSVEARRIELGLGATYEVVGFLQPFEMAEALARCSMALCRAGTGTLADLAAMRRPSLLVPLPTAFADHQRINALEFEKLGAASIILQPDLSPRRIAEEVELWTDEERRRAATSALAAWDRPEAVHDLVRLVREAGKLA